MMAATIYLGGVVVLEAWPVYVFLVSRVRQGEAHVSVVPLVLGLVGAFALTAVATAFPLRAGVRRGRSLEI